MFLHSLVISSTACPVRAKFIQQWLIAGDVRALFRKEAALCVAYVRDGMRFDKKWRRKREMRGRLDGKLMRRRVTVADDALERTCFELWYSQKVSNERNVPLPSVITVTHRGQFIIITPFRISWSPGAIASAHCHLIMTNENRFALIGSSRKRRMKPPLRRCNIQSESRPSLHSEHTSSDRPSHLISHYFSHWITLLATFRGERFAQSTRMLL